MTDEIDVRLRRAKRGSMKASHTSTFTSVKCSGDGDEHFDAHGNGVRREDTESETCAVCDASRHRHTNWMMHEPIAAAAAGQARLGPDFAASAAAVTGALDGKIERHDGAASRLTV